MCGLCLRSELTFPNLHTVSDQKGTRTRPVLASRRLCPHSPVLKRCCIVRGLTAISSEMPLAQHVLFTQSCIPELGHLSAPAIFQFLKCINANQKEFQITAAISDQNEDFWDLDQEKIAAGHPPLAFLSTLGTCHPQRTKEIRRE